MVPAAPGSTIRVTKRGISERTVSGLEIIHLPIAFHNIEQYVSDVMSDAKTINDMKAKNERFGFQLYGFNSRRGFDSIQELFRYLTGYKSFQDIAKKPSSYKAEQFIRNLIVIKAPKPEILDFVGKARREQQKKLTLGVRVNKSQTKAEKRAAQPEWKKEQYRAKRRAEEQKRRDKKRGKK